MKIDSLVINERGIYRRGFDKGAFGRKIPLRKSDGGGESIFAGSGRGLDDIIWINAVKLCKLFLEANTAFGMLPPF